MGVILYKWLVAAWMIWHPFYVSVTEIEHNKAKNELEVSCRIFTDDLENVLKKESGKPLDIMHPVSQATADSLVAGYISRHLSITADGKQVRLQYLGYKIVEESVWCFLSATPYPTFSRIHVKNDILYREHTNQINMVHVIRDGARKSTKLDNPDADADFSF